MQGARALGNRAAQSKLCPLLTHVLQFLLLPLQLRLLIRDFLLQCVDSRFPLASHALPTLLLLVLFRSARQVGLRASCVRCLCGLMSAFSLTQTFIWVTGQWVYLSRRLEQVCTLLQCVVCIRFWPAHDYAATARSCKRKQAASKRPRTASLCNSVICVR